MYTVRFRAKVVWSLTYPMVFRRTLENGRGRNVRGCPSRRAARCTDYTTLLALGIFMSCDSVSPFLKAQ
jgi:hypothetical protein